MDDLERAIEMFGLRPMPHRAAQARFLSAADFAGLPVPPREWHVPDLIPSQTVTLFYGDGGTGKSLLSLQLAVATVLGRPWIGQECRSGKVMYLSAEDDVDELHRRLADVTKAVGARLADLADLILMPRAGEDAILATLDPGSNVMVETPLFTALDAAIEMHKPAIVILDTLADLHSGNENDRTHARQVIGIFRGLAIRHGCAVLVLAHPSLAGMASKSGSSGSTGWNNSVRSRLYLTRVIADDGAEDDPNVRVLQGKKANYGPVGTEIKLRWADGAFHQEAAPSGLEIMAAQAKVERLFMTLLRKHVERGAILSAAPGRSFAPAVMADDPDADGTPATVLRAAMERLIGRREIVMEEYGPPSKRRQKLAPSDKGN